MDFLGSAMRREHLVPEFEVDPKQFMSGGEVLESGKTGVLDNAQKESAVHHWKIMRTVLPAAVWENW
jgi:hypothetical protein